MLSVVGEKLVSPEVRTALGSPWEWAEYLNIIYHVGTRGEAQRTAEERELGYRKLRLAWPGMRQGAGALDCDCRLSSVPSASCACL